MNARIMAADRLRAAVDRLADVNEDDYGAVCEAYQELDKAEDAAADEQGESS
jgi:hypothetical protein